MPGATDPTGRSFLCYKHERMHEAEMLVNAQHELGIPTWQDVTRLREAPLDTELRRAIRAPETANAVLWLTPAVAGSKVIREVEVPEIVRRRQDGDPFFVVPVAAGGLEHAHAAALVSDRLGVDDLTSWLFHELEEADLTPDGAARVAERVLLRRLEAVHRSLPAGEPLRIRLHNRNAPGFEPGWALSLDWHHRFRERFAHEGAWQQVLLPRLRTLRRTITEAAPGRPLAFTGYCTNTAALALGRTFSARGPLRCSWLQQAQERSAQEWSLAAEPAEFPLTVEPHPGDRDADALAVLLSLNEDVEAAFIASKGYLPAFHSLLRIEAPRAADGEFIEGWLETPGQVVSVVETVVAALRRLRRRRPTATALHLFAAIPVGLAFLLGQRLNTLGPVQTYEVDERNVVGTYRPELLLRPGDVA